MTLLVLLDSHGQRTATTHIGYKVPPYERTIPRIEGSALITGKLPGCDIRGNYIDSVVGVGLGSSLVVTISSGAFTHLIDDDELLGLEGLGLL